MARETGDMFQCVLKAAHHADTSETLAPLLLAQVNLAALVYRFNLINTTLRPVVESLKKIKEAAEKGDCQEVLRLFNGPFEFGHER